MLCRVETGSKRRQVLSGTGAMASLKARLSVSSKVAVQMLAEKLRPATAAASATAVRRLPAKAAAEPVQAGVGSVPVATVAPSAGPERAMMETGLPANRLACRKVAT